MRHITLLCLWCGLLAMPAFAAEEARAPEAQTWSFTGLFGTYDRDGLRRGYKVYKEVCASCHAMGQLSFRMLAQAGGPEFNADAVKAIAAEYMITDGPDEVGDMFDRPGLPTDVFPAPYANEKAARASNNGAHPPDLSLITKARAGGADYVYALLTGYEDPPAGETLAEGQYYNPWFAGGRLAMSEPLSDGLVDYTDGTPNNARQLAYDVVQFLSWAAEPELEARKRLGFSVIIYLSILAALLYLTMRRIWSRIT